MNGERDVSRPADRRILHNHVHDDVCGGDIRKDSPGAARFIPHSSDGEFCLVAIDTDATNNDVFHAGGRFLRNCSDARFETRPHFEFDSEFFCKLHRTRLHHLRPGAGHLEQLIISDLAKFLCISHDARIACEDTIDVSKNLADIRVQGAGQRDGRQVRAAPAKRGCFSFWSLTLETGNDHNIIVRQQLMNLFWTDVRDPRSGVVAIGQNSRLGARQRDGSSAQRVHRHGGQGGGSILSGCEQNIELTLGRLR